MVSQPICYPKPHGSDLRFRPEPPKALHAPPPAREPPQFRRSWMPDFQIVSIRFTDFCISGVLERRKLMRQFSLRLKKGVKTVVNDGLQQRRFNFQARKEEWKGFGYLDLFLAYVVCTD